MKNLFNQMKTGLSMVMVLTLFVTQFSSLLFQAPKTYALGTFNVTELVANAPAGAPIPGVQSVTKFIVQNTADDGDATYVAGCLISIVNGGTADRDCTDGAGLLDPIAFPTTALQGAEFHAFIFSGYAVTSGNFDREFVLTHTGTPITGNAPNSFGSGNFFLTTQDTVPGTIDQPGTPAVTQVVEFAPITPSVGDSYRITINGVHHLYNVLTGNTLQDIVEAFQPIVDGNADVGCNEDNFAITCYADVPGTAYTFSGIVLDFVAPAVTLSGISPETVAQGSVYVDSGATWTDNVDGLGVITAATSGSVNTAVVGTYILEYTYIDSSGNTGNTVTRTVNVTDQTAPAVTLSGISPETVAQGSVYVDSGATWTDNVDGLGVITAATSGSVNTAVVGTYILEYTYNDIAGNTGNTVTRTVNVTDQTAPVVVLLGLTPITVAHGSVYVDSGATWTDNVDGTGTISSPTSGAVNTAILGTYLLDYTYTDIGGNTGNTVTRTVNVTDQTAPVVTLSGFSPVAVLQNTVYVDAGATWFDNVDGTGFAIVSGSVDTGTVGTYYLQYSYTDTGGNISNIVTRTVNVYRPIGGAAYIVTDLPTPGSQNQTTNPETNTETSIDLNDLLNPTIDSSLCYTMNDKKIIDQGNGVSLNFMKSLQVLLNFDLTTIPGTKDYNPERSLTRAEAAKFLSLFAQNILCRETTKSYPAGLFKDLGQTDAGLQSYIKLSYEYEIFRGDVGGMFRPNDIISRDELIAVIVRLVTNEYDNAQGTDRAANYKATLNSNTSIPLTSVKRGNTAEVIYDLYRNNDYSMDADLGFVLR